MKTKKLIFIILLYIGIQGSTAKHVQKRGVMDNLNDGLKVAGQMFGINTAADVANLVAKAFSTTTSSNRNKPDIITTLLQQAFKVPKKSASTSKEESEKLQNYEETEEEGNHRNHQQANSQESTSTNSKRFNTKPNSAPDNDTFGLNLNAATVVTNMLRMVGFDATKLGALAINALIMIASAIGSTILGNTKSQAYQSGFPPPAEAETADTGPEQIHSPTEHQPRKLREGTPLDWFLKSPSPRMKRLLGDVMDSKLSDKITEMIENRERTEGQGACLKMLVCKSSPFIWGMQKSLKKRIDGKGEEEQGVGDGVGPSSTEDNKSKASNENSENSKNQKPFDTESFFTHLPTLDEYREHGEKCEKLYSIHCNVTDLYRKEHQKR